MSLQRIARSPDLKKLLDDHYEVEIIGTHLVVRSIPYVTEKRQVRRGVLACALSLDADDMTIRPGTHVVMFAGEFPCDDQGRPLEKLRHSENQTKVSDDLTTRFSFSNKPPQGYPDYYELITTYVAMISGPAQILDVHATAKTWRVIESNENESVFVYPETASSRAGISAATRKLETGPVAILGLGGTGSYVLDLLAKTPVSEIHLFDGDVMGVHNAFRSPGAASIEQLRARPFKVHYLVEMYSKMRRKIVAHPEHVTKENVSQLNGFSFVFLSMDAGEAKKVVVDHLEASGIGFIDVGMGIELSEDDSLRGIVRVTTSTPTKRNHVHENQRISFAGDGQDVYAQNIQVADLNALNAVLAVIKWKKLLNFYADLDHEHFCAYTIDGNSLLNEDK